MSVASRLTGEDLRCLQNPFAGTPLSHKSFDFPQILGKIDNFIRLMAPILLSVLRSPDNMMIIYTGKVGKAISLWRINKHANNEDATLPDIASPRHTSIRGH